MNSGNTNPLDETLKIPSAGLAIAILLISSAALAGSSKNSVDASQAYVAEIAAERQAADLKMRDHDYSPLAMTNLVLLKSKVLTIGSDPAAGLVLSGPAIAPRHAEIKAEGTRYVIRALDGQISLATGSDEAIDQIVLEKGSPRLRLGQNLLYFQESTSLGPMIRVLNFESPAYKLFDGLDYFPTNPAYRVEAAIKPLDEPRQIEIVDTMGFVSDAWVYGVAEFTLENQAAKLSLVLFTPTPTADSIFYVIFGDKTNGHETYGAGRYLLIDFVPSGSMTLDFNRSVNPSCAYNSGFACPMPPPGNRFSFRVPAGIKDYRHRPPR